MGSNSPGRLPPRAGAKNAFGNRLRTLTENISAMERGINNRKETYQSAGTSLHAPKFGKLCPRMAESSWRVFAPLQVGAQDELQADICDTFWFDHVRRIHHLHSVLCAGIPQRIVGSQRGCAR